ncbi:MAG TPA: hypothetical protein ENH35_02925 [Candidatus Moranbacteria bacterium]|nr:hypothetical protein [Candidatus Pacearchaeota archaeon]HDZ85471.1 hypothetical protein [Candidatus Moranbacteria bacterium]
MSATSRYHITITNSGGTYGFTTKKYSSRQKPDSLFGSRFSTGNINYSTMNRWQRLAQTTWLGGGFQKYWENEAKFRRSNNIDVLTNGEFKLSKKLSGSAKYDGSIKINISIKYNDAIYFAAGRYIYYTDDNWSSVSVSKDFGAGKTCTDLEIYNGLLYAAVGTFGLWYHDTSDHTTWAEQQDTGATVNCDYLRTWGDNLYITYTNVLQYFDNTNFTTVKDFSTGGDANYYIKKPKVYASKLYIPINIAGSITGTGEVWYYDGTNLDIIFQGFDPVGTKMEVYNSRLIFAVYGLDKVTLKQFDNSSVSTLQEFDVEAGITVYGSGIKYGTGALYGEGSDKYDDPINFCIWKNNLVIIMKRSASQNTMLLYDTLGWTEYLTLPTGADYSATMWLDNRDLYIGGSDGDVFKIEATFAENGYLQGSIWDAELQDLNKLFADVILKHDPLQNGDSIDFWYRTDDSQNFQFLGTADTDDAITSTIVFPTGANTVISTKFEYKIVLNSNDGTTTPIIKDVIVRYILAPENAKRVFEYTLEVTKKMKLLDKTMETRSPSEMITELWNLKTSGELLTLVDENADSHTVVFSDTTPEVVTPFAGDTNPENYVYLRLFEL